MSVHVFEEGDPALPLSFVTAFDIVDLESGSRTTDMKHSSGSIYYVDEGAGTVFDVAKGIQTPLAEGAMVHIECDCHHRFEAAENQPLVLIGGPGPTGHCVCDPHL